MSVNSITFNKTSNIFVNVGIIGLTIYLKKYRTVFPQKFTSLRFTLSQNHLQITCDTLLELLEEVYYFMGQNVYDTPTQKQIDENSNIFYVRATDSFKRFPKMNTYGLTHLLTNNAQGITRKKDNAPKITQLQKENPELASKINNYYESQGIKLLSKVYLNVA